MPIFFKYKFTIICKYDIIIIGICAFNLGGENIVKKEKIIDFLKDVRFQISMSVLVGLYIEIPIITLFQKGFMNVNILKMYLWPIDTLKWLFNLYNIVILFKINGCLLLVLMIILGVLHINGTINLKLLFNADKGSGISKLIRNICTIKEKKITYAKKVGTYGTADWQNESEIEKLDKFISVDTWDGIILGYIRDTKKVLSLPKKSLWNRNIAVFGSSGSMKSRSFVIPNILNLINEEESMFITDPKGELVRQTSSILQENGYVVRQLNLNNPLCSDRWNFLKEVHDDITAITFAQAIIQNTSDKESKGDFWEKGQENLLKALALYIVNELEEDKVNIRELYGMITQKNALENLIDSFQALDEEHVAVQPFNIFLESATNENVRAGMISGLATRLQLFQAETFKLLTEGEDIDLELPARKKCAYFIVIPDSHSSFDFMASLFFSFSFTKLMALADKKSTGRLSKQVNFIMDEFPNISKVPDFCKKISVIRSRGINVFVIFQNIAQLQNRYPDGQWEEILGNCDNQIFLGCSDNTTAEMMSESLGSTSVQDESNSKDAYTLNPFEGRESKKYVKRNLMEPDEVKRLDPFHSILMPRGQKPIQTSKMQFPEHPLGKYMRDVSIYDMLKKWSEAYHVDWLLDIHNVYVKEFIEKNRLLQLESGEKLAKIQKDILIIKTNMEKIQNILREKGVILEQLVASEYILIDDSDDTWTSEYISENDQIVANAKNISKENLELERCNGIMTMTEIEILQSKNQKEIDKKTIPIDKNEDKELKDKRASRKPKIEKKKSINVDEYEETTELKTANGNKRISLSGKSLVTDKEKEKVNNYFK